MFNHQKSRYSIKDMLALLSIGRAGLYAAIHANKLSTILTWCDMVQDARTCRIRLTAIPGRAVRPGRFFI